MPPTENESHAASTRLPVAALVFFLTCLALAVPLAAALPNTSSDADEYFQLARNLLAGHGYSMDAAAPFHASAWRVPAYPAFLAALLSLGLEEKGMQLLQAVLAAATATFAFVMTARRTACGLWCCAAICLLLALPLLASAMSLTPEVLNCLLLLPVFALLTGGQARQLFIAGLLLGIGSLLRLENLLLACLLCMTLLVLRKQARPALLVALGFAIATTPWLLRNWQQTGIASLTDPIYSYSNLAIGTSGEYDDPVSSLRNQYNSGLVTPEQREQYLVLARDTYLERWRTAPLATLTLKARMLIKAIVFDAKPLLPEHWSFRKAFASTHWPALLLQGTLLLLYGPLFLLLVATGLSTGSSTAEYKVLTSLPFACITLLLLLVYAEQRFFIPGRLLLAPMVVAGLQWVLAKRNFSQRRSPATQRSE